MKTFKTLLLIFLTVILLASCKKETRDKIKNAKEGITGLSNIVSNAKKAQEDAEKLSKLTPLTNSQLKDWLPKHVNDLERTGFKVGNTSYLNVSSIEGTFKNADKNTRLKVEVMDGAGDVGSRLMMSLGLASKMEFEEEDESQHTKPVTENGIRAQQTYYKKREDTKLQFIYKDRFIVMINGKDMEPEETWDTVEALDLDQLTDIAE